MVNKGVLMNMVNDLKLLGPLHRGFIEARCTDVNMTNDLELLEPEFEVYCAIIENLRRWKRTVPTTVRLSLDMIPAINRTLNEQIIEEVSRDLADSFREGHLIIFMGMGLTHFDFESSGWPEEILVTNKCEYPAVINLRASRKYMKTSSFDFFEAGVYAHNFGHHALDFTRVMYARDDGVFYVPTRLEGAAEPEHADISIETKLQGVFDRLSALKTIEDVDDEYTLKPTPRAHSDMKVAIIDARDRMGETFPLPRL